MIIVRISGGLGNQMFQYAAARSLALKNDVPLVLDTRHYAREREHGYALDAFSLADVPSGDIRLPPPPRKRLQTLLWQLTRRQPRIVREKSPAFDPSIAGLGGTAFIDGYFQSEKYFAAHAATIRSDLTPKAPPDAENAKWLAEIKAEPNAVSLHVRRGDYVQNARFAARHGTCTPQYYQRALAYVTEHLGTRPVVYAFSDDPDWVRENMNLDAEVRIPGRNDASRNVEDLRLMSACKHHIIANSSFSWWGAWLNPNDHKIVAAPARWYADPAFHNPDIWAHGWVRIEG